MVSARCRSFLLVVALAALGLPSDAATPGADATGSVLEPSHGFTSRLDRLERELVSFRRAEALAAAGKPVVPGVLAQATRWRTRLALLGGQIAGLPAEQATPLLARLRTLSLAAPDLDRLTAQGAQVPKTALPPRRHERETPQLPLAKGIGGQIAGTVINAATSAPLAGVEVDVYDGFGFFWDYGFTDSAGQYTVSDLPAGSYFAVTYSPLFADELYDDLACETFCDPTSGTVIQVSAGSTSAGIDFALAELGKITGTITDVLTGDPLSDLTVEVYDATTFDYVATGFTDAAGQYSVGGLVTGSYVALAYAYFYIDELYDNLACEGGVFYGCDLGTGTPIAVTTGQATEGIDFALQELGTIAGTITDADTGQPLADVEVAVFTPEGGFLLASFTDAQGTYQVGALPAGSWIVKTYNYAGYLDELYDDVPCGLVCNLATGTPVVVNLATTTPGIDFALGPGGTVTGTVSAAVAGGPPVSGYVDLWDSSGSFIAESYTDPEGNYTFGGLVGGTYFLTIVSNGPYVDQLYDGLPCEPGCDPTAGTAVSVTIGATTSGIDFVLDRSGSISGVVTDEVTGNPLTSAYVVAWDGAGTYVTSAYPGADGVYTLDGLPSGTYYVGTTNYSGHLDELWRDVPCPGGLGIGCSLSQGTPVAASLNQTTRHVNFALRLATSGLFGRITDGQGQPLANVFVDVWSASGQLVTSRVTNATGRYLVDLPLGTYYVSTSNGDGHVDEVYDDLPCPGSAFGGFCDPTDGTAVSLSDPAQPFGTSIDFVLATETIFSDGFESGGWGGWTVAVGGS